MQIVIGAKSSGLCIMCSIAIRRRQMCIHTVFCGVDSANESPHMFSFLFAVSSSFKSLHLMRASSRFIACGAILSCAVLIILAEDVA